MVPNPLTRARIQHPLITGIRAIDGFTPLGRGQRVGIFAGSGVGKSTLLGMIAGRSDADINVVALIGERGREVREFIENDLSEEGRARSIVIVATADQHAFGLRRIASTLGARWKLGSGIDHRHFHGFGGG
jgi:flagellum-specific ATP synthase